MHQQFSKGAGAFSPVGRKDGTGGFRGEMTEFSDGLEGSDLEDKWDGDTDNQERR